MRPGARCPATSRWCPVISSARASRWPRPSSPSLRPPAATVGPNLRHLSRARPGHAGESRAALAVGRRRRGPVEQRLAGRRRCRTATSAPGDDSLHPPRRQVRGRQFPPGGAALVAEAARQKADLAVLGETLTTVGLGKKRGNGQPVPGPSTEYFGELAAGTISIWSSASSSARPSALQRGGADRPRRPARGQVPQGLPAPRAKSRPAWRPAAITPCSTRALARSA